jgi:hypothetical protein
MELKPTLRIRVIDLVTYITLFALAVIPRLSQLDHFLMVDENLWYERSIAFTKGLVQGQWSQTAQTGHPGVTTMWAGAIGLALSYLQTGMSDRPFQDFVNQMATQTATLERLRWLRLPLAILSGLIIVVAYSLVRHLVDTWPAILGAVLMALEPLFLAHSRVLHHDSPAAIFSLLGILGWLLYMKSGRLWFILPAGFGIALAILSKVSSVFLLPLVGLTILTKIWKERKNCSQVLKKAVTSWALLLLIILIIVVLSWPVLWVAPGAAIQVILNFIEKERDAHAAGSFFLGQPVSDPGPLYYPLSLVFTMTPVTLLGLALAIIWFAVGIKRARDDVSSTKGLNWIGWMLTYIVCVIGFMSLIGKKQERYVLPAMLAIDLVAGWGWWKIIEVITQIRWCSPSTKRVVSRLALAIVTGGQVFFAWSSAPYYSTFYNPLLGGAPQARKVILIGRGEGLDQAVKFIREHSSTRVPRVASWYGTTVSVLFASRVGPEDQPVRVMDIAHPQNIVSSDYIIFYINQLQRERPKQAIIRYVMRKPLLYTVKLAGVDYAYVFKGDGIDHPIDPFDKANRLEGKASLAGFQIAGTLKASELTPVRLYWVNDGIQPGEQFYVRLIDDLEQEWGKGTCVFDPTFGDVITWQRYDIFAVDCEMILLPGTPPGLYLLRAGIRRSDGTPIGEVYPPPSQGTVEVKRPMRYFVDKEVVVDYCVDRNLSEQLELVGYDYVSAIYRPREKVAITLYWRARQGRLGDYTIHITLTGSGPGQHAAWTGKPVNGRYPTSLWQEGELVRDPWLLTLPPNLPTGNYKLAVWMTDDYGIETEHLVLAELTVQGRQHSFDLERPPTISQKAILGGVIHLVGYDLSGAIVGDKLIPGQVLEVTLTWQAKSSIDRDYVVFVHLLDKENRIRAQHDGQPGNNELSTTTWIPGEYVRDNHRLVLPIDLPYGDYRLVVGMYLPDRGERLLVTTPDNQPIGDHIVLDSPLRVPIIQPRSY